MPIAADRRAMIGDPDKDAATRYGFYTRVAKFLDAHIGSGSSAATRTTAGK